MSQTHVDCNLQKFAPGFRFIHPGYNALQCTRIDQSRHNQSVILSEAQRSEESRPRAFALLRMTSVRFAFAIVNHAGSVISGKKYCTTRPMAKPNPAAPTAIRKNCAPEPNCDCAASLPLKAPTTNNVSADKAMDT
jgi:hypothetical protein